MQLGKTIIALVLLVVVGTIAYLVSRRAPVEETTRLFKIDQPDITKIDLKYPDREIEIGRDKSGKWQILKPIQADADQTTCDNLARAIANCEIKKTLQEKPADLKPFGLDKPAVIVTITTKKQGVMPSIDVGKTTPVGFSAYIKTSDKPAILLASSAFPPGMQKKLDDLRDRELMNFKVDDVLELAIEHDPGPAIEVDKNGDQWNIVQPAKYPADPTEVHQILSSLANSRIADFISDAPASVTQYGLGRPNLTVTAFTGKENARQSLLFGSKQPEQGKDGIFVRRGESTPVYTVHPFLISDVNKSLMDLRDKTVLAAKPADVQRIAIAVSAKKFSLERTSADKWQLGSGASGGADAAKVERLLSTIQFLKGSTIAADPMTDPKKFGLDKPAGEIALTGKGGKDLGAIKLAKMEQEAYEGNKPVSSGRFVYYVSSSKGTPVYTIDDYNFDQLAKTADEFLPHAAPSLAAKPSATAAPTH